MTQRELAGEELSTSYVSLLESGRRKPTTETLQVLAGRLNCAVEELLGTDKQATRPTLLALRYGELALETGDAGQALDHFMAASRNPDAEPLTRFQAEFGMARAFELAGQLIDAANAYEQLVRDAVNQPGSRASLRVVSGWIRCLYELGELARAAEVGRVALEQLDSLDAWGSEDAVRMLCTVSMVFFEAGDMRQAQKLLNEGLAHATKLRSPSARASVLWNASLVAYENGRHRDALHLAEEALSIFRGAHDQRNLARLLTAYGYLLLRQTPPQPQEARRALEEALAELTVLGGGIDRGYALTELSRTHLLLGDSDAAVAAAEESLAALGERARLERARAFAALGAAHAAAGRMSLVTEAFARAGEMLESLQANRQAARVWVELAEALAAAGDETGALTAFRRATSSMSLNTVMAQPVPDNGDPPQLPPGTETPDQGCGGS